MSAYVCSAITNNYRYLIRRQACHNDNLSLDFKISDEDDENTVIDVIPSSLNIEEDICKKELTKSLTEVINSLDPIEKELIFHMYLKDKKGYARDFINKHKLSYFRFNRMKMNALIKIKEIYNLGEF